ncbi:Nucleotide-binding protein-like protein, partial [Operophtera brumata]
MFEKLKVPIIGLVENMSHAICYKCGSVNYIFGSETVKAAAEMGLDIIESFAVDQNMSECINSGKPAIYALPDSIHAEKYRHLANKSVHSLTANLTPPEYHLRIDEKPQLLQSCVQSPHQYVRQPDIQK